ncbi:LacI family DNA-binding transcriptional regulator [Catellatospora vulcania]|uniref:LacI family DNA-binding transcriptional regulator n=1 Tax=Catellatospora vulcania TaxID=1460450 RepID=UPI0012D39E00|nr:LacI family DNA-binding transcriptional regulator [Catellatospora vulcania]
MKRPTIADIAGRAGVSRSAVSFALNDQPGVSEETRQRVLAVASELGWRPHSAARALRGGRAGAIGLALQRPARLLGAEPFTMELISGLESELSARSCGLNLQVVEDTEAEIATYRRWWAEHRVDGVIVLNLRDDDPRVSVLEDLHLPAVVIGGPAGTGTLPSIWSQDAAGMTDVVEYLAALGHRRLAHVAGDPNMRHIVDRTTALHEVCRLRGLPEPVTVRADFSDEESAQATRRLLASPDRPTAIIYHTDLTAVTGLEVALEMGLSVPDELSLVAFNDSRLCRLVNPKLTALAHDIPGRGAQAARMLFAAIEAGPGADSQPAEPYRLLPRGSTGVYRTR